MDLRGSRLQSQRLPLLLCVLMSVVMVLRSPDRADLLASLDPDSVMRIVMVRDLLAGQSWFDLTQARLGLEGGIEMHWSRLVDAPLAGLILLFDLFAGRALAEHLAIVLWPLLMLSGIILLTSRIGLALGGRAMALIAAVVSGLTLMHEVRFVPGSVDHHNIQIVLLLLVLLGLMERHAAPAFAALAGAALAASLAIGVELLPLLVLCGLFMAVVWVVRGAPERAAALRFCAGSGTTLLALFASTAPASAWRGGYCDAISTDLVVPVLMCVGGLAVLAGFASRLGPGHRAAALAGVVVLTGAVAALATPACLSNPLDSLDTYLQVRWLDLLVEAQGLGDVLASPTSYVYLGYFLVGAVALMVALQAGWRGRDPGWLLLAALLTAALAMSAYQVRSTPVLAALSAIPMALVATRLHRLRRDGGRPWAGPAFLLSIFLPLPATWSLAEALQTPAAVHGAESLASSHGTSQSHGDCFEAEGLAGLVSQPPGLVSAPSNLGAQILLSSPHRTLAAPYHRNEAGMIAQLRIALAEDAASAHDLMRDFGVDYVVVCPSDPELASLASHGFEGFLHQLQAGDVPEFLEPLPGPDDAVLRAYRVR